ncbi:rhodanese-like domain-containing protein [Candidatus Pelagibacter bacterium]|nr:rhodanese-like domain-containing protein [Candidatus Pelagibacter bacterium]
MSLIETVELEAKLETVKIIDCSWHMPQTNRNGHDEYKNLHIPDAIFFDLDKNSKKETELPHMLVGIEEWKKIVSNMGISNDDQIVIYDNSDVISSCRCWYNFIYYGHNPKLIKILNGGLKKWIGENREIGIELPKITKSNYKPKEFKNLVKDKNQINENIIKKEFSLIDARSIERFNGEVKEPRAGLRSGNIENSTCIPFTYLINTDKTFKTIKEIKEIFNKNLRNLSSNNVVFSCGSGVTACVLALAYSLINDNYLPIIYDGSWSEYGQT